MGGSKPVADEDTVILSYSSGEIYALDQSDGSLKWFDNIGSSNFFSRSALNDIQSPLTKSLMKKFYPNIFR